MTLLRLSISRNFSDSFFFLSFFPFFAPIHFPCIGPSWRRNETGTKRGRIGTDFCSCPFPWYCDCAISDELVKLAQSAVRLHVAVHPPCHSSFLYPLRLHPCNPLFSSSDGRWTANDTSLDRVSENLLRHLHYIPIMIIVIPILETCTTFGKFHWSRSRGSRVFISSPYSSPPDSEKVLQFCKITMYRVWKFWNKGHILRA